MSNELRLLFQRDGSHLTYRVASSSAIGEPQPFAPFLTGDDYEDLRWYLVREASIVKERLASPPRP